MADPLKTCRDCGAQFKRTFMRGTFLPTSGRCEPCGMKHTAYMHVGCGKSVAYAIMNSARRNGRLAPAAGQQCVDCGAPAQAYDHRDYSLPLQVEPVCNRCNRRRGTAKPIADFSLLPSRNRWAAYFGATHE